jgi:hypothetical protein
MNQGDQIDGPNKNNCRREPINKIGILATAAVFAGWFLGISTNGVFNFFNDSPGFQLYPFCFALWVGIAVVTVQFVLRHGNIPWLFMVSSIICVVFFVFTDRAVEKKRAVMINSTPVFTFSVLASRSPDDIIELTNTFLRHPANRYSEFWGCLAVPIEANQTNILLRFWIGTRAFAQDCQVFINLPKEWDVLVDNQWTPWVTRGDVETVSDSRGTISYERRSWMFRVPFSLLPGNSIDIPPVWILSIPTNRKGQIGSGDVGIWAQAKDCPPESVGFQTYFFPRPITDRPMVIKPTITQMNHTDSSNSILLFFPYAGTNETGLK